MFNKLRNNYIITNMSVLSIIIIVTFLMFFKIITNNDYDRVEDSIEKTYETVRNNTLTYYDAYFINAKNIILLEDNKSIIDFGTITNNDYILVNGLSSSKFQSVMIDNTKYYGREYLINSKIIQDETIPQIKSVIVFENVTNMSEKHNNLLRVMILLFFVILAVLYLVSVYLAERSIKHLKDAWEKQREFISDASHELKTPLSIINTSLDALVLESQSNQWTNNIKHESLRMNSLISDLLYLSKMDEFKSSHNDEKILMSEVISELMLSYEVIAYEKGILINKDIQEGISVKGNEKTLKQLIHILLDNAIKYSGHDGIVDVTLLQEFNRVTLTVENTGEGINQENISKVFDRFYKQDSSRVSDSSSFGLGLSIAKSIVDNMEAEIEVQSVKNKKTKFTIYFYL